MYSIKHVSFLIRHKGKNWKHHQRLNCLFAHLGKRQSESEWAALWKASVLSRNHMEVSHASFWASESHDTKRAGEIWQLQGAIVIRSRLRVPLAALFRIALISALLLVWNQRRDRPITQLYTTVSWASFPVLSRLHLSLLLVQIFQPHFFLPFYPSYLKAVLCETARFSSDLFSLTLLVRGQWSSSGQVSSLDLDWEHLKAQESITFFFFS